jgi:hypothetical protein
MMNFFKISLLLWSCAFILSGCIATTQINDKSFSANKAPVEVFLTLNNKQWEDSWRIKYIDGRHGVVPVKVKIKNNVTYPTHITTVHVLNEAGVTIGKRVLTIYTGDIVIEALEQKMNASGYKVKVVKKLPSNTIKGIDISVLSNEIDQYRSIIGFDATCNVKLKLDFIKNGLATNSYTYESALSDDWIIDGDENYLKLLKISAQNIVNQAMPSILKEL